ncbi:unnamed protein product, partial [Mesorhabditis spiculigera]
MQIFLKALSTSRTDRRHRLHRYDRRPSARASTTTLASLGGARVDLRQHHLRPNLQLGANYREKRRLLPKWRRTTTSLHRSGTLRLIRYLIVVRLFVIFCSLVTFRQVNRTAHRIFSATMTDTQTHDDMSELVELYIQIQQQMGEYVSERWRSYHLNQRASQAAREQEWEYLRNHQLLREHDGGGRRSDANECPQMRRLRDIPARPPALPMEMRVNEREGAATGRTEPLQNLAQVCQQTATTSQVLKAAAVEFNKVLVRLDRLAIDDRSTLNDAETRRDQAKKKYDNYLMEMKAKRPKDWIAAAPKATVPAPPGQPANGQPAALPPAPQPFADPAPAPNTPPTMPRDAPDEVQVEPDPVGDPFNIRVHASSERVEAFSWRLGQDVQVPQPNPPQRGRPAEYVENSQCCNCEKTQKLTRAYGPVACPDCRASYRHAIEKLLNGETKPCSEDPCSKVRCRPHLIANLEAKGFRRDLLPAFRPE